MSNADWVLIIMSMIAVVGLVFAFFFSDHDPKLMPR